MNVCVRPAVAAIALATALVLTGCQERLVVGPREFRELRTYGWDATVPDPEAEWAPYSNLVLARAANGFALLDEGSNRQQYFGSQERRDMRHAAWINSDQFVFGPQTSVIKTEDGRVVPAAEGLVVVTLNADRSVDNKVLSKTGTRPRPWKERIVAQVGDQVTLFDSKGRSEEFAPGFCPVPQTNGDGLAWQETPVLEPDLWTTRPQRGALIVRWDAKHVDTIPSAITPAWTAAGGLCAVVLRADPTDPQRWWKGGSDVVHLAAPGAKPVVLFKDAHAVAPHPIHPVAAITDNAGVLHLVDLSGQQKPVILAAQGDRPRWNTDGTRLLVQEPYQPVTAKDRENIDKLARLNVRVLRITPAPVPTASP